MKPKLKHSFKQFKIQFKTQFKTIDKTDFVIRLLYPI